MGTIVAKKPKFKDIPQWTSSGLSPDTAVKIDAAHAQIAANQEANKRLKLETQELYGELWQHLGLPPRDRPSDLLYIEMNRLTIKAKRLMREHARTNKLLDEVTTEYYKASKVEWEAKGYKW